MLINLVCSHHYNILLKKIKGYSVDLGKSYTTKDIIKNTITANIKDGFVNNFFKDYGDLIYKTAVVGSASIYTYSKLQENQIIIYKGNEKFIFEIDTYESTSNIELSFAKLIMGLQEKESE